MEREIILVDEKDRPIGFCSKERAHREGLLHRAFSVFIIDKNGRMLLQKRAKEKYHSGGLWANGCCSHPRKGEALGTAVERRLFEELGIKVPKGAYGKKDCRIPCEWFSFIYRHEFSPQLFEYELDHVFLMRYDESLHGPLRPDPREIQELWWLEMKKLSFLLKTRPDAFACWFELAAPRVLSMMGKGRPLGYRKRREGRREGRRTYAGV